MDTSIGTSVSPIKDIVCIHLEISLADTAGHGTSTPNSGWWLPAGGRISSGKISGTELRLVKTLETPSLNWRHFLSNWHTLASWLLMRQSSSREGKGVRIQLQNFLIKRTLISYPSSGGLSSIRNTLYKIKIGDTEWTRGRDMPTPKTKHTCSLISNPSSKIVVVGGTEGRKWVCFKLDHILASKHQICYCRKSEEYVKSVYIYSIQDDSWSAGNLTTIKLPSYINILLEHHLQPAPSQLGSEPMLGPAMKTLS